MSNSSEQTYFYVINYPKKERELCFLEMKTLFDLVPTGKHLFSSRNIDPSRSPFMKVKITLLHTASSLEELTQKLRDETITFDKDKRFKFERFKWEEGSLDYAHWLHSVTELGKVIQGEVDMQNPSLRFGLTILDGVWLFGIYEQNQNPWEKHNLKPCTNSNSLETRTARAIVNIAVGLQTQMSMVDPCCGVGTVVLEALSLGVPVVGYEISWTIANQAKQNVAYFGYEPCIVKGDMNAISEMFDVAIIDMPYGLFSPITYKQQKSIITTSRRITGKLVIITSIDMDEDITGAGFTIVERCTVNKGAFVRYVRVCH